jgi:hypothetical protein
MPLTPLLARSHQKFVAFSAVGVAMVCVPLMQVLQYQEADLQQLQAQRTLLDPVAVAVNTQYGLLAHRSLAAQTLAGQDSVETARRQAQTEVDNRVKDLGRVLSAGAWHHALAEAQGLAADWQVLAQQVADKGLTAADSNEAHQLRVEQALQVVDLVAVSLAPLTDPAGRASPSTTTLLASARVLARAAVDMSRITSGALPNPTAEDQAATPARGADSPGKTLAATLQALQALQSLHGSLAAATPTAGSTAPDPALDSAWMALQASGHALAKAAAAPAVAEQAQAGLRTALAAQQQLFAMLHRKHAQELDTHVETTESLRQALLSALAVLAALATALGMALVRTLQKADQLAVHESYTDTQPAAEPRPPSSRDETGRLLRRLRDSDVGQPPPAARGARQMDQEDTLPPAR